MGTLLEYHLIMEINEGAWTRRSKHFDSAEVVIGLAETISRKTGRVLSVWECKTKSPKRKMLWTSRWGHLSRKKLDKDKLLYRALVVIQRDRVFSDKFPETRNIAMNLSITQKETYQILIKLVQLGCLKKNRRKFDFPQAA